MEVTSFLPVSHPSMLWLLPFVSFHVLLVLFVLLQNFQQPAFSLVFFSSLWKHILLSANSNPDQGKQDIDHVLDEMDRLGCDLVLDK